MKQNIAILSLALSLTVLSGCARQERQITYIGAEAAKELALQDAGVTAEQAQFSTADMNHSNGLDFYDFQFTAQGTTYQYSIDALSGSVIDSHSLTTQQPEVIHFPMQPEPAQNVTEQSAFVQSSTSVAQSSSGKGGSGAAGQSQAITTGSGQEGEVQLTLAQAKEKALAHAGISAQQAVFVESKLDWDDGRRVYELEFYTSQGTEYDCEVNAVSGQILSFDWDDEGHAPSSKRPAASNGENQSRASGTITAEKAKLLVLAQVPGAVLEDIREFETDQEHGRLEYEGNLVYNQMEYEFEIDGYSGAIRGWEVEPVQDKR